MAGVTVGEIIQPSSGRQRQSLILGIETLFLAAGALLHLTSAGSAGFVAFYPIAFAMGLQNATMQRAKGISIGVTYVTGTLVQAGRAVASTLRGKQEGRNIADYLVLWLSLAIGAGLGGAVMSISVSAALFGAAAIAGTLAAVTASVRPVSAAERS